MAQSKSSNKSRSNTGNRRTTTSSNSRSSSNTRRKTTNTRSGSSRNSSNSTSKSRTATKRPPVQSAESMEPSLDYFISMYKKNRIFKTLIHIAVIVIIVLLDLLFAWNNYDRFFKILGVELILAALVAVFILFVAINDSSNSNSDK